MIYVIRTSREIYMMYEGIQQKIFEINGRAVHPVYPIDNSIEYIKDVEKAHKKSKKKNLVDVLREVDASCAECMLVAESDHVSKLQYSPKFKDEIKIFSHDNKIRYLTTPFQFSQTEKGRTKIFYPAETEIYLIPSNYKNFFGNFSQGANEKNARIYEIVRRYVDLFGNAECITRFLSLLNGEFTDHKIPSFDKFEKICDKLLTDLELRNETESYRSNPCHYGEKENGRVLGAVPPHLWAMCSLEDEFNSKKAESLLPQLLRMSWMTYTDEVQ